MNELTQKRLDRNAKFSSNNYFKLDTLGTGFALMLNKATTQAGIDIVANYKYKSAIPLYVFEMILTDTVYNASVLEMITLLFQPDELATDMDSVVTCIAFLTTVLENYDLQEYELKPVQSLLRKLVEKREEALW